MNLIEALSKYDKVTCDEIQEDHYLCFYKDGLMWLFNNEIGSRPVFTKKLLLSNSYREWKEK